MTKGKSLLFIVAIAFPATFLGLGIWIGSMLLFAHFGKFPDAKAVFNDMIMLLCVLVLLPLLHRGMYRTFWNNDERQRRGEPALQGTYLDGNQPLPPPVPRSIHTPGQTAAYVACYVFGIAALLWLFLPLHHADMLQHFIGKHSSGTASAGSLLGIVVGFLPMVLLLVPLGFLLNSDQQAIAKGCLPAAEELRLRLKIDWLFAFAAALIGTAILCQMASSMVLHYL